MEVPRRSFALVLSPLRLIDGFPRRSSFSYDVMPEEPIKLTVLKLDGSSFDIRVVKTASVRELKMAVEEAFSHLQNKGPDKISWPHVWGHFCLCYECHRLINETDNITNFGIKDGDQLRFIRHVSNNCILVNKQTKTRLSSPKQLKLSSPKRRARGKKGMGFQEDSVETIKRSRPSSLATIFGSWVSYYWMLGYRGTKRKTEAASCSRKRGVVKEVVSRFGFKCYSEKDVWNMRLVSET